MESQTKFVTKPNEDNFFVLLSKGGSNNLSKSILVQENIHPIPNVSGCFIHDLEAKEQNLKLVLEKTHLFVNIENSLAEIHFTTEYKNTSD